MQPKVKLLDQVRAVARMRHLSHRTEDAYPNFIKRYILFHDKRHPKEMGADEISVFLTHLAVKENVAATAQNQAFFALLFLYRGCPANYFAENRRRFQSEKTGTFAGRFYAAGSRGDYMPLVGHTFYGGELAIRFGFAAG
ncbi:MAG: phage integrase N-terminal SAM-like domain-containing protein [Acidobacteria bacterium]|jgi:hypothetical protein|nr:phage integrase N-terminal SAM-like domain-containing protein [Acidobacteriota bacterium]